MFLSSESRLHFILLIFYPNYHIHVKLMRNITCTSIFITCPPRFPCFQVKEYTLVNNSSDKCPCTTLIIKPNVSIVLKSTYKIYIKVDLNQCSTRNNFMLSIASKLSLKYIYANILGFTNSIFALLTM